MRDILCASRCKPANDLKQSLTCKKVAQTAVKLPKDVVIIRPEAEDGEIKTSEEARDAVFTLVTRAVRKINGNGLMVETTKPEELKVFTENEKLGQHPTQAYVPDDNI